MSQETRAAHLTGWKVEEIEAIRFTAMRNSNTRVFNRNGEFKDVWMGR